MRELSDIRVGVVGLGYVGLPLAVELGRHYPTVGFDIDQHRIDELSAGMDDTREVTREELQSASGLSLSSDPAALEGANTYIVTVPTPVDRHKRPDTSALIAASRIIGGVIKPGDVVIYESTVYPGATEELCVPILEAVSGYTLNKEFFVGYSPERINTGDKSHRLTDIVKVTSGSTAAAAQFVDRLYRRIIPAGTHQAPSIRVAEAAKVIENVQRDLNIALINELALIFERLEIDTEDVLKAAGTKWNFLPFKPGLVGGHCISVDPYYLTFKAQELGYKPEMILAGRRINDGMGAHIADRVVKLMSGADIDVVNTRVLVLGLAFKEDCPDTRNTRVVDLIAALRGYDVHVDVWDPWVSVDEARASHDIDLIDEPRPGLYDAVVLAVAHRQFIDMGAATIRQLAKPPHILFDVKAALDRQLVTGRL